MTRQTNSSQTSDWSKDKIKEVSSDHIMLDSLIDHNEEFCFVRFQKNLSAVERIVCSKQEGKQDHYQAVALICGKVMVTCIKTAVKVMIRSGHIQ